MRRLQKSLFVLGSAVALAMPPVRAWAQAAPGSVFTRPDSGPATPIAPGTPGAGPVNDARPVNGAQPVTTPGAPAQDPNAPATQPAIPQTLTPPSPTISNVEIRIPASRPAATKFSFNFKDTPIDAVLNHISAQAGFTVIKYTPIEGRVTVVSLVNVSAEEAVSLLNTVLSVNGYAAVQEGKTLKIMSRSLASKSNIPVHYGADPEQIPANDDLITQVIPVKTVDAAKLKQDLATLIGPDATLSANAASNVLIMIDTQANIRRIVQIVSALDKRDPASSVIVTRKLKNADATSAVKLITDIFKTDDSSGSNSNLPPQVQFFRNMMRGGRGGGGGGGGFGGGPGGGGGAGAASTDSSEGGERQAKVIASADVRTNSVVVTGPKETLDLIEEKILDPIDADPISEQSFFLYPLKNATAANLQTVLNSLFSGGGTSGSRTTSANSSNTSNRLSSGSNSSGFGSSGGSGSRGGSSGFGSSGGGGSSFGGSSSSRSGSSSSGGGFGGSRTATGGGSTGGGSSGSSTTAAELQGQVYVVADPDTNSLLVATASKYQDQVRAIIAELDRPIPQVLIKVLIAEVTHENTDDLSFDFSVLNQRTGTTTVNGTATNNGVVGSSTSVDTASQTGGLVVSLVEKNVQATLKALQVANKLDVLSRPYILATDNQPAEIVVGSEVPFVTDSNVTSLGTIVNSVSYRQIGIILDVTPHINPDGLVIMDVAPEISSQTSQFVTITQGVNAQVYTIRSAYSRVGVKDGNTVVIGGLMQDQKTAVLQKVPILGDIPLLGLLFQNNHVDKTKTELLIFMTPHVAQQPELLKTMSKDETRGLKLTPGAVQPGTFDEHIRGLQRGGSQPDNAGGNLLPAPAAPTTPGPATMPVGQ